MLLIPLGWLMDEQIAISEFVATAVHSNRVLLNGVEATDPGPSTRARQVLVMQRLEEEKHTDVALRAWSASKLRKNGWRLVIAGRGRELYELRRLSTNLGLSDSIEWPGFVDDPTQLLTYASVLLAPAPDEPFGLTVVEAMARATPVIAADGGAHRETVGSMVGSSPLATPPHALASLTMSRIGTLLLTETSSEHGNANLFDIETHADKLLQVYLDSTSQQ